MSEKGRYIVKSLKTGKKYCVEPIGTRDDFQWGSLDPSSGKQTYKKGMVGDRSYGSIKSEKESIITEENGFINIKTLPPGMSPEEYIEELERKYEEEKSKEKK